MSKFDDLMAAKRAADEALAGAHDDLASELIAAKDAHRENPTDETRVAKGEAVAAMQAFRAVTREGRAGVGVGGDATKSEG